MNADETLIDWLRTARRVIAFCGAGVSAESGVPTFRGAGGLWEGYRIEDVATPEAFRRDPELVWRFYALRQEQLPTVQPNPAHLALAGMEARYDDFLLVTQNVDDLHERAGSRKLVKLHGSLMETRCVRCGLARPLAEPVPVARIEAGKLPECACGGLLRPNVVWFGEYLDPEHFERVEGFFRRARAAREPAGSTLLLVIGTSGMVSGGYGLTFAAREAGARSVEINPQPAFRGDVDRVYAEPAGVLLGRIWPQVTVP